MVPLLFAPGVDMLGSGPFMPVSLLCFTGVTDLSLGTAGPPLATDAGRTVPWLALACLTLVATLGTGGLEDRLPHAAVRSHQKPRHRAERAEEAA